VNLRRPVTGFVAHGGNRRCGNRREESSTVIGGGAENTAATWNIPQGPRRVVRRPGDIRRFQRSFRFSPRTVVRRSGASFACPQVEVREGKEPWKAGLDSSSFLPSGSPCRAGFCRGWACLRESHRHRAGRRMTRATRAVGETWREPLRQSPRTRAGPQRRAKLRSPNEARQATEETVDIPYRFNVDRLDDRQYPRHRGYRRGDVAHCDTDLDERRRPRR
jgi:hypothetical protein